MPSWINRTELSGSSVAANGTTSHTCTFTGATANNFLLAIVAGSVTFTTPTGWTLLKSYVGNSGIYAFTKTAASGENSFTTTHNAADYAIRGVVYEFFSGSSGLTSNSAGNQSINGPYSGPTVTGLTGTYSRFCARSLDISGSNGTATTAWTLPSIEDYDSYIAFGTHDGVTLTIAYDDNVSDASFTPNSTMTTTGSVSPSGEGIAFGLSVIQPAATVAWLTA